MSNLDYTYTHEVLEWNKYERSLKASSWEEAQELIKENPWAGDCDDVIWGFGDYQKGEVSSPKVTIDELCNPKNYPTLVLYQEKQFLLSSFKDMRAAVQHIGCSWRVLEGAITKGSEGPVIAVRPQKLATFTEQKRGE